MYVKRHRGLGQAGSFTDQLAQAIARFEGYNVAGSVAQRNNNPGNLRSGPGQTGTDPNGYAIFPDVATGYAALDNQISLNIGRGLSLDEFFAGKPGVYPGYAPSSDANNPAQYASTVAGWLGIDPTVPLSSIAGSASSVASVDGSSPDLPETSGASDDSGESGTAGLSTTAVVALGALAAGVFLWVAFR
jgi:hypothetical protein